MIFFVYVHLARGKMLLILWLIFCAQINLWNESTEQICAHSKKTYYTFFHFFFFQSGFAIYMFLKNILFPVYRLIIILLKKFYLFLVFLFKKKKRRTFSNAYTLKTIMHTIANIYILTRTRAHFKHLFFSCFLLCLNIFLRISFYLPYFFGAID